MNTTTDDRSYWFSVLQRIATPPLRALAEQRLKQVMPVEIVGGRSVEDARKVAHLEALGRTLAGIAPWLESPSVPDAERGAQRELRELARAAIRAGTDPSSPDYMNFTEGNQPLVDAAFLAQGILRAPTELWEKLDAPSRQHVVNALKATRSCKPHFCNWLLFSAIIEAVLCKVGEEWDAMRVDYAVRQHEQWYLGDGMYSDGPDFHWDYYNSFVIQPMLVDVLNAVAPRSNQWNDFRKPVLDRARRHAAILERMISPEGTFPPIGRSITYRFGALQLLGQMALMKQLPVEISPAQVRCAMTAVIRRQIEVPGTFDKNGWLTLGFCGHQPALAESYICTGSVYLCAVGLLPLGLPAEDAFWSAPSERWTSARIWSGENLPRDHAI